jgi:ABC-2 type transport system ATP-binding protein
MIECRNLSKIYYVKQKKPGLAGSLQGLFSGKEDAKHALSNVSFSIKSGETVGLIGANGAGKTTLVKMLSGIMVPSSGSAQVLGHIPWRRETAFKKQISIIMGQKAQLWWDLPAEDCFLLLKDIYQIPAEQFNQSKNELVGILDVGSQMRTPIRKLSLGERMKMELIAALLHRPGAIFLDEPTIGLDVSAQNSVRAFLKSYGQKYSPGMILTSHYMDDIESLCSRVLIVRKGELVYDGLLSTIQEKFSAKKKLLFTLKESFEFDTLLKNNPFQLDVLGKSDTQFGFECERNQMSDVASWVLANFNVVDLSIEEQDLSQVIELILKGNTVL